MQGAATQGAEEFYIVHCRPPLESFDSCHDSQVCPVINHYCISVHMSSRVVDNDDDDKAA